MEKFKSHIYDGLPIYETQLVREREFSFDECVGVSQPADVAEFLYDYFAPKDREEFLVLFLNTANKIIGMHVAHIGSLNASVVDPKQVFKSALLANSAAVILAHNHPSGNTSPSREDISMTKKLKRAGDLLDIPVHDHLIIAGRRFTSMADQGVMR